MSADPREFVVRRPRHEAIALDTCRVWLELDSRQPPAERAATLIDVSRHGLQVTLAGPVDLEEHVVVHIEEAQARLDVALAGYVRWQRPCEAQGWTVGCVFDEALRYEVMGELFLAGILNMHSGRA
jgi:hypothetical protein